MKKLKIAVVTYSRADYGPLFPVLKLLLDDSYFDLKVIVTGTHLSTFHGHTVDKIIADGIPVSARIATSMASDTEHAVCNAVALGLIGFSEYYRTVTPGAVMVLGDRYELWSACVAAVIHKIPIIHLHGGESTRGLIDDSVRHSLTKMAAIHFPSMELYARRIRQMGEAADRIFVTGAPGIDNIHNIKLLSRRKVYEMFNIALNRKIGLMTFHPVTLDEYASSAKQAKEVMESLIKTDLMTIITMPNIDTAGNSVYDAINGYTRKYPQKFKLIKNLGQKKYLSTMKYARVMVGNSSSAIIESASFKIPVVNIGDRQAGRFKPANIIDCPCEKKTIIRSINKALSSSFAEKIKKIKNPYGDGAAAKRMIKILKKIDFSDKEKLLKKGFCELSAVPDVRG